MNTKRGFIPIVIIIALIIVAGGAIVVTKTLDNKEEASAPSDSKNGDLTLVMELGQCGNSKFMFFKDVACDSRSDCTTWAKENKKAIEKENIGDEDVTCCVSENTCGYYTDISGFDMGDVIQKVYSSFLSGYKLSPESKGCSKDFTFGRKCDNNMCECWGFPEITRTVEKVYSCDYTRCRTAEIKLLRFTDFRINGKGRQQWVDSVLRDYEEIIKENPVL
ncbi:hypothetical protein AMJ49_05000 [Parcubacteria bacterium DG_74_2]|nr:MAG: hypothetical protein AMJ49_05000 [Parcubacteria bacterium DG_74_2]